MADSFDRLPQTLADHITELRGRLTKVALLFALGAAVGYAFHDYFIETLKRPLHEKIYYTSPAGGFNFVMKVCLVFGLIVALPALVYNLIDFIRPAFKNEIKKSTVRLVTLLSLVLALGGGVFAFLVVVPMSLHFFANFTDGVTSLISATDYLSFIINCVISFMVIFQAPLIVLFIDKIKPLTPRKLLGYERYVVVGSLASALILPFTYDPMTQFLIAIPIFALYNLSIIFVFFTHSKRKRAQRRSQATITKVPQATRPTTHSNHKQPGHAAKPILAPVVPATINTQQPVRPLRRQRHMDIIPRAQLASPSYNRATPLTELD